MAYFPMFVPIEGADCLVAGGGRVAASKIRSLLEYGARVHVVAPVISGEIRELGCVSLTERKFLPQDTDGCALVIAATDDREQNHEIAELCRRNRIPVNAVDQKEDCSFLFPSYVKKGDLVAAFSTGGKSPVVARELRRAAETLVTDRLAETADYLGSVRRQVIAGLDRQDLRKQVFEELFGRCMNGDFPDEEALQELIGRYRDRQG